MPHTCVLIPGDGIGPEVASAAQLVLELQPHHQVKQRSCHTSHSYTPVRVNWTVTQAVDRVASREQRERCTGER